MFLFYKHNMFLLDVSASSKCFKMFISISDFCQVYDISLSVLREKNHVQLRENRTRF